VIENAVLTQDFSALAGQAWPAFATIAGVAAGALGASSLHRRRQRLAGRRLAIEANRLQAAEARLDEARALSHSDAQCVILWKDGEPQLLLHTLSPEAGVPAKLTQILRFSGWLAEDAVTQLENALANLRKTGERFSLRATARVEQQALEITGFVYGPYHLLQFRELERREPEIARLLGENRRLRASLTKQETILNALPAPAWTRGPNGALSWVNKAYAQLVEAESPEAVIEAQMELFETRQRKEIEKACRARGPQRIRLQTIVSGERRIFDAIAVPLPSGSAGAAFDAAPLASAKVELERLTAAHARTLDRVATAVAIFDASQRLIFHNESFLQMWSLDERWLSEKPTITALFDRLRQQRLIPEQPDYRRWRDEHVNACLNNRTLDEWWHLPDGRAIRILTDLPPGGDITFLFDDVTEKLNLERKYHDLNEVQRETLDHLREGVAVFGPDGRLRLHNPASQSIWSLDPAQLAEGAHLNGVAPLCEIQAEDATLWTKARAAITGNSDGRQAFSGHLARRDGAHLAYAGMPLPDGAMLLTVVDITDSKRVEEVLLERNEALEAADRLKSSFLSHISYELRTPLTSIIGFTDLLGVHQTGPLNTKQREYLNDIKTSSITLLTIINDMLDLAIIDAGVMELKLEDIPVQRVIEAAQLGVRERLHRLQIALDVHIAEDVETVFADERRLMQILYNLLLNAIGFSVEGGAITLGCRREGSMIAFSVQDTGCGIPEEEQKHVFTRFESRSQGSKHRGAGLGLSIVKSLVELHNGVIDLRSTPGAGTTVTVLLPEHKAGASRSLFGRSSRRSAA
jgi:signal transduction histidine kinase